MNKRRIDLTGRTFGRLVALHAVPGKRLRWLCLCNCGVEKLIEGSSLRSGRTESCGCLHVEVSAEASRTHGLRKTPTYFAWVNMRNRCERSTNEHYDRYGGRGIVVCERWKKFENFLADMGLKPAGLTLDRVNNDGNYEPGNVQWASRSEQAQNRSSSSVTIQQVRDIRRRVLGGERQSHVARSLMVSKTVVNQIVKGRTWRNVQ